MQTALVEILINGNLQHSVVRVVTAPEVIVLRGIHGKDSVINVSEVSTVKRSNAEEIERLGLYYTPDIVSKMFPGSMPKLPTDFSEVGVETPKESKANKADKADKVN